MSKLSYIFPQMALAYDIPMVKLNNGKNMPALALGTYLGLEQVMTASTMYHIYLN